MSREEFKAAFREVISSEFAQIPTDEDSIDFTFSEKFIKRMDKLIRAQKKSYYKFINTAGKRVAVIFAAIITLFTASLSVKAIREPVVRFIKQVYETFIHYTFEGDIQPKIKKEFFIKTLPDGFIQHDKIESDLAITTIYVNDNNTIKFTQQSTNNANHFFDNESGTLTKVTISGINVDIYESENIKHAVWTDEGYFFKLTCLGEINIDSVTMMIESIQ